MLLFGCEADVDASDGRGAFECVEEVSEMYDVLAVLPVVVEEPDILEIDC